MNKLSLFSIFLIYNFCISAQPTSLKLLPDPLPESAVPNQLDFPKNKKNFLPFFDKLNDLIFRGSSEINIVHIGGSHVQAGMLTDAIRFKLQSMSPGLEGERGFFFPFALAHTNNPRTYKTKAFPSPNNWTGQRCSVPQHKGPWGLSGIRAWTRDTSSRIQIFSTNEPFGFKQIRIFAAPSDSSMSVKFLNDPDSSWYNSSIDAFEARYKKIQDTINFRLFCENGKQNYFSLEGVQVLRGTPGLRYHAIGANGAATHSYLKCARFKKQLNAISPDLVLFGLGINDAYKKLGRFDSIAFERNYDSIVKAIQSVNSDCSFIFLTNNDSFYKGHYNPHGEVVRRSMYRLAKKHSAAVHDLYSLMGGRNSIAFWIRKGWAKMDGIHMTSIGYGIQAYWLAEAIEREYLRSQIENNFDSEITQSNLTND
ncbi:MAG: GDSL-type esterase/lipase family protein [Schleiferiaceae bacterium]